LHFSLFRQISEREKESPENVMKGMGLSGSTKIWIGKDYTNFIHKDFVDLDKPFTGEILSHHI
jgi:phospholipase D1/2